MKIFKKDNGYFFFLINNYKHKRCLWIKPKIENENEFLIDILDERYLS